MCPWGRHRTPEASILKCKVPVPPGLLWEWKVLGLDSDFKGHHLLPAPSRVLMERNIQDKLPRATLAAWCLWIIMCSCFSSLWIAHLMRSLIDGQCSLSSQHSLTTIFLDSVSSKKKENLAAISSDKWPVIHAPHTARLSLLSTCSCWAGGQWSCSHGWLLLWSDLTVN